MWNFNPLSFGRETRSRGAMDGYDRLAAWPKCGGKERIAGS